MQFVFLKSFKNHKVLSQKMSYSSSVVKDFFDIIITGGGLVGTCLACTLAKNTKLSGIRILLLEEASKHNRVKFEGYSNRVSALNQGTVNLMHSIGVWNKITQIRFKPVRQLQVFDINGTNINFMNETTEPVAYIVENDVILDALYNQLKELPNVKILNEVRVKNCKLPSKLESKALVELNTGKILSCNLLVGADGHNSLVRKEMQSSHINISYNQMGVVATLTLSEATPNDTAWQRFLPNGPVAMLPLTNDLSSLVWTTTPEHAKELLKMDTQHFVDSLNDAFYRQYKQSSIVKVALQGIESFLGSDINTSVQYPPRVKKLINKSRAAFPLGFSHVSQYIARGAAIVGDAAHRIHPLAGQGVNLGFDDAKSLSEILGAACYRGAWLGEQNHLLMYERERLRKNLPIMLGVHGLQRLYQAENNPIVALRTIGLKITNALPLFKKIIMKKASNIDKSSSVN